VRQQVAGIVVNRTLSLRRHELERLEAILTNCARLGTESQNREGQADFRAHLRGRVAFVERVNPAKGAG
jgi:RNA-directed DNA polymerase